VATDTRLWLYKELQQVQAALHDLIRASVDRAEADVEVLMPGFTHLQVHYSLFNVEAHLQAAAKC
jgi:argininosuccinate lyase